MKLKKNNINNSVNNKINILVVGYPKSGNTWLVRLLAEILNCPVQGFWGARNYTEIAVEGIDRQSIYSVYKGHQRYEQVRNQIRHENIIYIVRDVRDVVISGANYFAFGIFSKIVRRLKRFTFFKKPLNVLHGINEKNNIRAMIEVVDKGNDNLPWCEIPWDDHVNDYMLNNCLIIRYEDLLEEPLIECKKILDHLSIIKSHAEILQAIQNQSFDVVRDNFIKSGDIARASFMRAGKKGSWKRKLDKEQIVFLENRFKKILKIFKYIP